MPAQLCLEALEERCVPASFATVMSGLDNPRGLAFSPEGALYVAEAGRGGPGPSIVLPPGETVFYGTSGAVSRLLGGVQQRVLTGLPSLGVPGGAARGLFDIGFNASGEAFGIIGFGGDPALRSTLGPVGADFGRLVRLPPTGGPVVGIADLAGYEGAQDPDGRGPDSNPYGLLVLPGGGFVVADAGGNDVLGVTTGGVISTLSVLPERPNPLPFGPPLVQAVPTTVALGPDGAYYVGELTGVPFVPGFANVYRLDPLTGDRTVAFSGFTNIVDLTFGPDGSLYVLQISRDGLASPTGPVPGALIRVDPSTGAQTTILSDGLVFPTGVVVGPDGSIYVSNRGTSVDTGEVIRITLGPAEVESVVVNDGSVQRSMVNSLTVTFDRIVTLGAGAFELQRQSGSVVNVNVATSIVSGRTMAVLTFAGPGIIGGSLADGNYTLTIRSDRVHDGDGTALDGDGDGSAGGDRGDAFFRLYGDSDGDRDVDLLDLGRFLSTFGSRRGDPHFLWYMDFNGDDRVGLIDLFAFVVRLGTHLNP